MKHVKPLTLNEDLFNIRDLDYVDAFSELFEVFAHLKLKKYIDRDGLFDSVMKNKLESLYSDLGWGALVLNTNISKFFKF